MLFRVGQKVVCVDADGAPELTEGRVYTIREILPPALLPWRGEQRLAVGILLDEVQPPHPFTELAPMRFRPAVERKTDISIFTEILNGQRVPEKTHI